MSAWSWFRSRGWAGKLAIGLPAIVLGLVLLYVAGRSLQFAAAEREAGLYLPSTANLVVRAKDLEGHAPRLEETGAWRVLRRRVLRDPAIRPALNAALKDQGLPTLDDLEDNRNSDVYSPGLLLRAAGRDAAAALQVGDTWNSLRWFAATRLRWSDYLVAPLAHLVLPREPLGGAPGLRLRQGRNDLFIVFEGRLALVSNDRALMEQALRRKGVETSAAQPVSARVEFGSSRALLDLRGRLRDSGALSQVRMDSVRAIEASADLKGLAAVLDVLFEGGEATRPDVVAPHALARRAPPNATGQVLSSTGVQDLFDGLRSLTRTLGPSDPVGKNIKESLDLLDEVGFSTGFLPKLGGGMALLSGSVESEGRVYPALAFVIPSPDPKGAVEALSRVIKERGGRMAEARFEAHHVGEHVMWSFEWPRAMQVNDFLRPCFAALPGAFVFGNNFSFTESILRGASEEGGPAALPVRKLKEYGISPEPALAGGYLLLPALRESLDGPLSRVAVFLVDASLNRPQFRAQLEAELRQQGRSLPAPEVDRLFYERIHAKERDQEDELRESLHVLDFMKWAAFSMEAGPRGVSLRAALEFR